MPVEEDKTTCSLGVGAPLTVPVTTFAKVTAGNDSEDVQAAAGSRVPAPRRLNTQIWCSQAWTLRPCNTFPSRNGVEKGDESSGDAVPSGDAMRGIFHTSPFSLCYFLPLRDDALGCFLFSAPSPLHSGNLNLKNAVLGFCSF